MARTRFNLVFKDDPAFGDWEMTLITPEPSENDEVEALILNCAERLRENDESPSPVTILDQLCEEHPGWEWEDSDYDSLVIETWK